MEVVIFSPIIISFFNIQVWVIQGSICNILLKNYWLHLFKIVCLVKGKGTCSSMKKGEKATHFAWFGELWVYVYKVTLNRTYSSLIKRALNCCLVKGKGTCSSMKKQAFRKSPRIFLTSPLCQLREKSCQCGELCKQVMSVFTKCGELCKLLNSLDIQICCIKFSK
jgi:hypothetical protein